MSATRPASVIAQSGGAEVPEVGLAVAPSLGVTPSVTVAPSRRHGVEIGAIGRDRRLGLAAVGGLLAVGVVIAVAAAHTVMLLPESIRPAPHALAGAFGAAGLNLHVGGEIAALVLMFLAYAAVVTLVGQLSARVVLIAIAGLYAVILLAPPLASTDVFSYQAYARMGAVYHVNPYTHGPYGINPDPVFSYVGAKWYDIHSAYGPVFTVFSYLLAPLTIATSVFAYKSIALVAGLALVAVVWQCARLRGTDPVRAAALVGLNPLLVLYGIGGGHNDLLMLLAMMGGVYAILASREAVGGGLSMLAVGVKLTAGLVLPFALAAPGRRGRARRGRWRLALGTGTGIAALAALSIGVFGSGSVHMLGAVIKSQREGGWMSIPGAISTRLDLPTVGAIAGFVLAGAFAVTLCWLLRRVWRGEMDWIDGAAWATLAMLVASSSLLPWYVAWLLPLAALGRDRRLAGAAILFTGLVQGITLLGYIPHGFL
ncbi:MAG TPA: glycosyltransferase 87 family protein [Solirubrobacteraceae bacterium]|nr:glycosyltransferase 87 family protein [Solirubrobacteraceae bacterium]